jgi:hypothetical protein
MIGCSLRIQITLAITDPLYALHVISSQNKSIVFLA